MVKKSRLDAIMKRKPAGKGHKYQRNEIFFIMKNAPNAKIPLESWEEIVAWLDKTFKA